MRYKLILWDFDGTLADSLRLAHAVYNRMAAQQGFKPVNDTDAVRQMSMSEFLKSHAIPKFRVPLVFAAFLREMKQYAAEISLHTGIPLALSQISKLGIRQAIVSSNSNDGIRKCLQANDADGHFEFITGTSRLLGKERRIRKAVLESALSACEVLYVGDEVRDIEAAKTANVDIAAASWGLNSEEALASRNPTHLISKPCELLPILEQIAK